MASGSGNWRTAILLGFRACIVGQMIAIFSQALLAGSALSGNPGSLTSHVTIGGVALVFSILQLGFGILLTNKLPGWVLVASAGLLVGEIAQMASGRRHWFAVHLPLGLALFATLVPLVLWVANELAFTSARFAHEDSAGKWSIGGE